MYGIHKLFLAVIVVSFQTVFTAPQEILPSEIYSRCPKGSVFSGQETEKTQVRSALACFSRCSQTAGCVAVTVCLRDEVLGHEEGLQMKTNCTLLDTVESVGCDGMVGASWTRCYSARLKNQPHVETTTEAEVQTTTELTCQNGGHVNGNECWCPPQYGGSSCERLIRDCTEPYNRGFRSPGDDGVYIIQPVGAPRPFQVKCELAWGGATYPFTKTSMSMPNTWSALKNGFGDNLTLTPTSKNYFVGLDNLHYLTSQGVYSMQFLMTNPGWFGVFYDPFVIGNENSSYRLTYSNFFTEPVQPCPEDLFEGAQAPIRFSTSDLNNGCTQASATAGWYDVDCVGFSPFADVIQWPTEGGVVSNSYVVFALVRWGDIYEG